LMPPRASTCSFQLGATLNRIVSDRPTRLTHLTEIVAGRPGPLLSSVVMPHHHIGGLVARLSLVDHTGQPAGRARRHRSCEVSVSWGRRFEHAGVEVGEREGSCCPCLAPRRRPRQCRRLPHRLHAAQGPPPSGRTPVGETDADNGRVALYSSTPCSATPSTSARARTASPSPAAAARRTSPIRWPAPSPSSTCRPGRVIRTLTVGQKPNGLVFRPAG
jgi:hypothetical protein